jgi:magnesium chelatase family protein
MFSTPRDSEEPKQCINSVTFRELAAETCGPSSDQVRETVMAARARQQERLNSGKIFCNAQMSTRQTRQWCKLSEQGLGLLERAMERFKLSARAYGRILKISRTIADLEGAPEIGLAHLSEAIGYRSLDRGLA